MLGDTIRRALRAPDAGGDAYEHLDLRLATRLGGALFLIGIAYVLIVAPLAPPRDWRIVGGCLAVGAASAVWLLSPRPPRSPEALLAFPYFAVALAALYRYGAGPGSPFQQLLFLIALYTAAVHPVRRTAGVLAAATAAAISPALYETMRPSFAAEALGQLALVWSLSAVVLVWVTRTRDLRRELAEAREEAERHARLDALTGLANRRAFQETLPRLTADARRHDRPLAVLVADVDAFKSVNDAFGHPAGDEVLRGVARALTAAVRMPDPCFRWGGDEFVALLRDATLESAREIAARVAGTVALSVRTPDGMPIGISVGCAELLDGETGEDMTARADTELIAAKARRAAALRPV